MPRLSPWAGRSIATLRTARPKRSTIGRQLRRSKVRPCRKTTGTPSPSMSYASLIALCAAVAIDLRFPSRRYVTMYRNGVSLSCQRMGRPREHNAETAAALVDAAERVLQEEGLEALTVRRVATEVG